MSPRKHTRFFSFETEDPEFRGPALEKESVPYAIVGLENYHALFNGVGGETAIGEASHSYLYQPTAAERIKEYAPGMKLIAILRNPAERAYSHYRQMIRDGREPIGDFRQALATEEPRIRDYWWPDFHYVRIGLYYNQLKRYLDLFDREQMKVYLYEDLESDPRGMMRDVFWFLNVDEAFAPEVALRYNASGSPKNEALHSFLQGLRRVKPFVERGLPEGASRSLMRLGSNLHNRNLDKPGLSPEVRRWVTEAYFREDIMRLQGLIRRDLSKWLE